MTGSDEQLGPESKIYVRYPGAHASPSAAPSGSIVPDPVNPHVSAGRPPAPESLPVGTDALMETRAVLWCFSCEHSHDMNSGGCTDACACRADPDAAYAPAPAPVGTDSARAEAERRYAFPMRYVAGTAMTNQPEREAFIAGAEWARAEERKARGG